MKTLELISAPGFFEALAQTTARLVTGLNSAAANAGVRFIGTSLGGMFGIFFRSELPANYAEALQTDKTRFNQFFHAMLARGIYLAPSAFEAGFVSAAHTSADIDATIAAAKAAFEDADQT